MFVNRLVMVENDSIFIFAYILTCIYFHREFLLDVI